MYHVQPNYIGSAARAESERGEKVEPLSFAGAKKKGDATPATILRPSVGSFSKRDGVDPVDDADLLVAHFDLLDQSPDDFATRQPIRTLQAADHLLRKVPASRTGPSHSAKVSRCHWRALVSMKE